MSRAKPKSRVKRPAKPATRPSGKKRWALRLILMLGVPVVFLALLELILRLCGFGYPTAFLLPYSTTRGASLVQNNQFGWRFFGARMSRLPAPICIPQPRESGVVRIMVFGESAAFGDPQPRFGLPRMLEAMLEARHPGTKFEVVNAAMTAINSHVILPLARDCEQARADVWVVYMGNNEVVGPFGAGTVFGPQAPPMPFIRAGLALKSTRMGEWLDSIRQALQKTPLDKSEWGGMEMFLDQRVRADDPRMTVVRSHFERNLSDIIGAGRDCGAGVVVSTVAVNLGDCAPFASLHRAGLSADGLRNFEELFKAGCGAQEKGNWNEAAEKLQAAAKMDDSYAELRFRTAQCLRAMGKITEARSEFADARDLDALRFRCDRALNDIIRRVVKGRDDSGVLLADSEQAAAAASPDAIPGWDLFLEHVHPTIEGNYVLGRCMAEQIEKLLEGKLPPARGAWPDMADCKRRLAWTERDRQEAISEILGRMMDPPFNLQANHAVQEQRLKDQARKIPPLNSAESLRQAVAVCATAISNWPGDALLLQQMAELNQARGDNAGVVAAATRSLDLLPSNQACWLTLGLALAREHDFEKAASASRRVFELDPQDVWGRQNLALCLEKLGRTNDAVRQFKQALAIKPQFGLASLALGQLYEKMGRQQEADECFRLALIHRIHRTEELTTLARFCESRGWHEAAATNYADAIKLSPSDPLLRLEAGEALAALGRHEDAAKEFAEAAEIAPGLGQAHFLHGLELGRLSRGAEAEAEFRESARLMPELAEAKLNLGIALYQEGKFTDALEQFDAVLRRDSTNAIALRYAGALRSRQEIKP